VIPTVGFFIRSQAFFHALLIEQNFPAMSRGSRTLVGLGFSEDEARRLGRQLCDAFHATPSLVLGFGNFFPIAELPRVSDLGFCALPITHLDRLTHRAARLARQLHFLR
jgi:hypothetical protein